MTEILKNIWDRKSSSFLHDVGAFVKHSVEILNSSEELPIKSGHLYYQLWYKIGDII